MDSIKPIAAQPAPVPRTPSPSRVEPSEAKQVQPVPAKESNSDFSKESGESKKLELTEGEEGPKKIDLAV